MKCSKCGFTNLDYADSCRQCNHDLTETRMLLGITPVKPGQVSFLSKILPTTEDQGMLSTEPETISSPENDISTHPVDLEEESPQPVPVDLSQIDFSDLEEDVSPESIPGSRREDIPAVNIDLDLSEIDLSSLEVASSLAEEPGLEESPVPPAEINDKPEELPENDEIQIQIEEAPDTKGQLEMESDQDDNR